MQYINQTCGNCPKYNEKDSTCPIKNKPVMPSERWCQWRISQYERWILT